MKVLFDSGHGQKNWKEAGVPPRQLASSLSGIGELLQDKGYCCEDNSSCIDSTALGFADGLIIPPPAGRLNPSTRKWMYSKSSIFKRREIIDIIRFIFQGGWMLAFTSRSGDSFTQGNLRDLCSPLGCILNDETVVAADLKKDVHPIHTTFETPRSSITQEWAAKDVMNIVWRPVNSFTILPAASAMSVVVAPPNCVGIDYYNHKISYIASPICIAGEYGKGKFVVIGGPHAFEVSQWGLFQSADNAKFLRNILSWLEERRPQCRKALSPKPNPQPASGEGREDSRVSKLWKQVSEVKKQADKGKSFAEFVKQFLSETEILKPLTEEKWSFDREAELDLIFECVSSKPLWASSRGLVPVECKNWEKPIGSPEVTRFADKVTRTGSKIGFFCGRRFTDKAWIAAAKARLLNQTTVGFLSDMDFLAYISEGAEAAKIVEASLVRSMIL